MKKKKKEKKQEETLAPLSGNRLRDHVQNSKLQVFIRLKKKFKTNDLTAANAGLHLAE